MNHKDSFVLLTWPICLSTEIVIDHYYIENILRNAAFIYFNSLISLHHFSTMVAVTEKKAAAEKKPVKGKEDSKKLPAVPESVLKHRKRREALRTRRLQV